MQFDFIDIIIFWIRRRHGRLNRRDNNLQQYVQDCATNQGRVYHVDRPCVGLYNRDVLDIYVVHTCGLDREEGGERGGERICTCIQDDVLFLLMRRSPQSVRTHPCSCEDAYSCMVQNMLVKYRSMKLSLYETCVLIILININTSSIYILHSTQTNICITSSDDPIPTKILRIN